MWKFIIGVFVGAAIGIFVMCLARAGADDHYEDKDVAHDSDS